MWRIVIGDIHGHAEKLTSLLGVIKEWRTKFATSEVQLVFLGDYIDRGPDSRTVLQTVRELQAQGAVCLRGNHEDLMIRSVKSELDRQNFLINGGVETCRSLGTVGEFADAREWMQTLPYSYDSELHYFVHAGVRPDLALREQSAKDQMWIREPFLSHSEQFEKFVVHGHTPIKSGAGLPDVRPNRCNVDTGAGWSGPLSAAIFQESTHRPVFLLNSDGVIDALSQ